MTAVSAFRCAYCYYLNPARKTRPQAPHLPEFSEGKTSLAPSAVALETDQGAPTSSPGTYYVVTASDALPTSAIFTTPF